MGFIITESNMRRSRIRGGRRRRCPRMKKVLGRSGFLFRCHKVTNEREREKHAENHQTNQYKKIKK